MIHDVGVTITRRSLLLTGSAGLGVALLGCAPAPRADRPSAGPPPGPRPIPGMDGVEREFARRIGVHAVDTATGAVADHRDGERFLMCSTVKALMAALVLHRSTADPGLLGRRVRYGRADLLEYAPVCARNVATGMTVAELCDAAVTVSDNTAHNLLLRELGGPAELTEYLRGIGDDVTRADRIEPALNEAAFPGDEQDTSTPAAFTASLRATAVDPALPPAQRDRLAGWLRANTTGAGQIRAGVPSGWAVGDKTGSGSNGEKNDAGVLYPPQGAPVVLTVFTAPADPSAPDDDRGAAAVAATTRAALAALGHH